MTERVDSERLRAARKVLAAMDGSEFEADDFPTLADAQEAGRELEALLVERERYREALEEIAAHSVISEEDAEFPDDACDWRCAAQSREIALAALAPSPSARSEDAPA